MAQVSKQKTVKRKGGKTPNRFAAKQTDDGMVVFPMANGKLATTWVSNVDTILSEGTGKLDLERLKILKDKLNVKVLSTGYDNRFGHDRKEGFDDYVRYGQELGIEVYQGYRMSFPDYDVSVSSSSIRRLLSEEGDVETAAVFLERPYQLSGKVMPGEHIGHQLGFPTANLQPDNPFKLIPASGAYAVWATIGHRQERLPAMMNIGTRPTFDGRNRTLEVNILDFDGNLYGQTVTITFVTRLREERRFESPEALIAQLETDKEQVKKILE